MIDVKSVSRVFTSAGEEVVANRSVNLRVDAGEFVVISGPSGSGKTTLLNMIGALDRPSSGEVWVDGVELGGLGERKVAEFRRDRIGFVFQRANLVSSLNVLDNVLLQRRLQGTLDARARTRATDLLEKVGLASRATSLPGELSGGQQQRVAIVRAVAAEPAVVIADEPTASLDARNAEEVLDLFRQVNDEHGMTIVASSHDDRVIRAARREVHLVDGEITSDRTIESAESAEGAPR